MATRAAARKRTNRVEVPETIPVDELTIVDEHTDESPVQTPDASPVAGVSAVQKYSLLSIYTFADCVLQKDETGLFDVLARNFDKGNLSYFLNKVGYGHLSVHGKGHDDVDYIRKVAHELFKAMKDFGKPVARW